MKKIISLLLSLISLSTYSQVEFDPFFTYGEFEKIEDVKNNDSYPGEIIYRNNTDQGYKVLTTRKIYAALGARNLRNLNSSGTGFASIGLVPNYDTYGKWELNFQTREQLNNFKYRVPRNITDIDLYNAGDSAYWNVKGGIDIHVGIGTGIFNLGPKVHIDGGFAVYVQKKSSSELYIEIRKMKTRSISLVGGTFIAYGEVRRLVEKSNGIAFSLDISSQEGRDLYSDLVDNGRVSRIQESEAAFNKVYDISGFKKLSAKQVAFGVPIIPIIQFKREWDRQVVVDSRVDVDGNNNEYKQVFSVKRNITRIFGKKTFMETMAIATESALGESVSLVWQKKSTKFTFKKLRKTLAKLNSTTGLNLSVKIPNNRTKLGFAKVRLELLLSESLKNKYQKMYKNTTSKAFVSSLQKVWKNKGSLQYLIDQIQNCGGSFKLHIYGKNISSIKQVFNYDEATPCYLE